MSAVRDHHVQQWRYPEVADPWRVPEELWIKGGFGGDGFSGCQDRVGKDIDLNTSSRYFVGLKIARIVGKRKFDATFSGPTEYFVETSQSFVTVKPILIRYISPIQNLLGMAKVSFNC